MKKSISVVFIILILSWIAMDAGAQSVAEIASVSVAPHELVDDAWALQFGVLGNSLTSLSGSIISAKHHFSSSRALRYGLSVRANYQHRDETDARYDAHARINAQYMVYPTALSAPSDNIHLFYGIGPELGLSFRGSGGSDATHITVGAAGSIGAEWFVKTRISLSAEYLTSVAIGFGTRSTDFRLDSSGGRLGVSVYF